MLQGQVRMKQLARLLGLVALGAFGTGASAAPPGVTVFAAASLANVLQEVGEAFTAETKTPVAFSFAASSALARQIEAGAPADVFVSADQDWMDYLQARNLIAPESRVDIASNELVLVAAVDSSVQVKIAPGFPLAAALGEAGRLATGDPASVPVGKYARAALTALGAWASVENRTAATDNVRTALSFVVRGEAPLGIVYATDARVEPRVRVVDVFPASSHGPITYPAAATGKGAPDAVAFVRFLAGPKARAVLARAGFGKP